MVACHVAEPAQACSGPSSTSTSRPCGEEGPGQVGTGLPVSEREGRSHMIASRDAPLFPILDGSRANFAGIVQTANSDQPGAPFPSEPGALVLATTDLGLGFANPGIKHSLLTKPSSLELFNQIWPTSTPVGNQRGVEDEKIFRSPQAMLTSHWA